MAVSTDMAKRLSDEASRIEEDTEFSAKGHYNAAESWRWRHRGLGVAATIASALTAGAALKEMAPVIIVIASVVAAVLTAVLTFLKPAEEADRHHRAGDQSLVVRNRVRVFRNIDINATDADETKLIRALKQLADERHLVLKSAPVIPQNAYQQARAGIEKDGQSTHRVDRH